MVALEQAARLDLAAALDPVRLARRTGLVPDNWQETFLRSSARQLLLNCSRQSGKSTAAAWLAVHETLYHPGALALCLSPSIRQSQELFRKVREGLRALSGHVPPPTEESALRLELPNGSRVACLPGTERTVRGYSGVTLLLLDEASRVPDPLYEGVRPMLAVSGGRIVLLSTPWGKRGFYYQEWVHGAEWERIEIHARDCPRIDPAWLAREKEQIPEWLYRQEYECAFVDTEGQLFASDLVLASLVDDLPPLFIDSEPAERKEATPCLGFWG